MFEMIDSMNDYDLKSSTYDYYFGMRNSMNDIVISEMYIRKKMFNMFGMRNSMNDYDLKSSTYEYYFGMRNSMNDLISCEEEDAE